MEFAVTARLGASLDGFKSHPRRLPTIRWQPRTFKYNYNDNHQRAGKTLRNREGLMPEWEY